jgi:hypothetical protein
MSKVLGFFESTVDFRKKTFRFSDEAIGKVIPFKFKNKQYQIHLPKFERDTSSIGKDFIVTRANTKIGLNWIEGNKRMHASNYGYAHAFRDNRVIQFSVSSLIIRSSKPMSSSDALKSKENLIIWRDLMSSWLEVLHYHDLETKNFFVEQERSVEAYIISSGKKKSVRRVKNRKEIGSTIHVSSTSSLELKVFRKALKKTESGMVPPDYYIMLISGLKHLNKRMYRQAIFDVSTATEIALTELLDLRLSNINPLNKKSILSDTKQLNNLVRALRTTGEIISMDLQGKIGTPRNKAIHKGMDISESQAREAILTARMFIETKLPIK